MTCPSLDEQPTTCTISVLPLKTSEGILGRLLAVISGIKSKYPTAQANKLTRIPVATSQLPRFSFQIRSKCSRAGSFLKSGRGMEMECFGFETGETTHDTGAKCTANIISSAKSLCSVAASSRMSGMIRGDSLAGRRLLHYILTA
jgi:hypothetical protein